MEIQVDDIDEGWTMVEATVVMECINEDGELRLVIRHTSGVTAWKAVGMLRASEATQTRQLLDSFLPEDEDNDD